MNKQEAKKYTKHTILTGNKERISKVLQHYWKLNKPTELKNSAPDVVELAKEIFNV